MDSTLIPTESAPSPRRWTRAEYHRLAETGFLEGGPRTELIDGLILEKIPTGNAHVLAVKLVFYALAAAFAEGHHLAMQTSLPLSDDAEPEPDVFVLRGSPRDYDGRDPDPRSDVALIVEVSDSTRAYDRGGKVRLYAQHGIAEYWVVDLRQRTIEVRRRPLGEGYAETRVFAEGESVSVAAGAIAVAEVMPQSPETS